MSYTALPRTSRHVLIHLKEGCLYCDLAVRALRVATMNANQVGARKITSNIMLLSRNPLSSKYRSFLKSQLPTAKILEGSAANSLIKPLQTESIPVIAFFDTGKTVAMWRGFDPLLGAGFEATARDFLSRGTLSKEGLHGVKGQVIPKYGQLLPLLQLPKWGTIQRRTLILITSSECPACRSLHPEMIQFVQDLANKGVEIRIIDTASTQKVTRARLAYLKKTMPEQNWGTEIPRDAALLTVPIKSLHYRDPANVVGLGWGNLSTPTVYTTDHSGRLRGQFEYRGSVWQKEFFQEIRSSLK